MYFGGYNNLWTLDNYNGPSQIFVSIQKEEFIRVKRVNSWSFLFQSVCPSVFREIRTPLFYEPVYTEDVKWNFEKFLLGPDGRPVYRYAPEVDPSTNDQLKADIVSELNKLPAGTKSSAGTTPSSGIVPVVGWHKLLFFIFCLVMLFNTDDN